MPFATDISFCKKMICKARKSDPVLCRITLVPGYRILNVGVVQLEVSKDISASKPICKCAGEKP